MREHWQDILNLLQGIAGVFGWAICLTVAARYVFGASKRVAFRWFLAGLAISAISYSAIAFSTPRVDEPSRDEPTMLAMIGGTFSGGPFEDIPRPAETLAGLLAIPILVMFIGGGYLALRRAILERETEVGKENPEQ